MIRASIYIYSFPENGPNTTAHQLQRLRAQAIQEKWEILHVYSDTKSTVGSARPSFEQMLMDAKRHRFDVLLFWSLAQLSQQNTFKSMSLLHQLSFWDICFYSYTEPKLNTCHAHKDIVISIIDTMLKQNQLFLGQRTRDGLKQQQRALTTGPHGRLGPGRPPALFDLELAKTLRTKKDYSYAQIAETCGVSKATICRFFKTQCR